MLTLTAVTQGDFSQCNTKISILTPEEAAGVWAEPDDIFIQRSNTPELVGTAALYAGPRNFAAFPDLLIRIRPAQHILPKFLALYLKSESARRYFRGVARGIAGSMPKIGQEMIESLLVPVPPVEIQRQIVSAIETHFSRLDNAVASLKRAKANVKRARASVLKAAVEGRLVPTEAALARAEGRDYEPASTLLARILTERRARWTESGAKGKYKAPSPAEERGDLPAGWTWATVEQLSTHIVDCLHSTPKFTNIGHVCLDTNAMGPGMIRAEGLRYVDRETFDDRNRRLVPTAGDVVFAREGSVGNAVVLGEHPVCLGQRTMLMRPSSGVAPRFVMHWIMSPFVRAQYAPLIAGSTVAHVNMADIRRFTLPLPPLAEQRRIVAEVDRRLSVLDALDANLDANLARCAKLRQSILKRAFEGKLVHPDAAAPKAPQLPLFMEEAAP